MTSSDAGALELLPGWFLRRRLEAPPSSRALAAGGDCGATDASASKACSGACAHRTQARHTHTRLFQQSRNQDLHTHAQSDMTCAPAGLVRVASAHPTQTACPAAPAARAMEHCRAARSQPAPTVCPAAPAARPMQHCRAAVSSAHNHALHACTYTHNTTTRYLRTRPERRRL